MFLATTWTSFLLSNVGIYLVYVTQVGWLLGRLLMGFERFWSLRAASARL